MPPTIADRERRRAQPLDERARQARCAARRARATGDGRRPLRSTAVRRRCRCAGRARSASTATIPSTAGPSLNTDRDLRRGRLGVADLVAQHDHRAPAEDRRDVHAVGEVEPLHITQPARSSRAPEVGERVVHAGRTLAVASGRRPCRRSSGSRAPDVRHGRAAVRPHTGRRGRRRRRDLHLGARPRRARRRGAARRRPPAGVTCARRPRGRFGRRRRRAVAVVPRRRRCHGRQPLLLRGRQLRAVPVVLVPAHGDVPAVSHPARRRDPSRPRARAGTWSRSRRPARSCRRTTTCSSGSRRSRAVRARPSGRHAPTSGSASSGS